MALETGRNCAGQCRSPISLETALRRASKVVIAARTSAVDAARLRRLAVFVEQIEYSLTSFCRQQGVSAALVEEFCNETYAKMIDSREELPFMELLAMMTSPSLSTDLVKSYNRKLRNRSK